MISSDLKKTIVFIGRYDEKGNPECLAVGVLIDVEGKIHLVTCKHVVVDRNTNKSIDKDLLIFNNTKKQTISPTPIESIKKTHKVKWIFHENPDVDIAVIPFYYDQYSDDIKAIGQQLFKTCDELKELNDIFMLSYQPKLISKNMILPIARDGIISLVNNDKTFYIDTTIFPGNSGSPVFLKPFPFNIGHGLEVSGNVPRLRLLGIACGYITQEDVAVSYQTGEPRIIFQENTGLSRVWSISLLNEIVESEKFNDQLQRL